MSKLMHPVPPAEPSEKSRFVPNDKLSLSVPAQDFFQICEALQRNELLGPAAATALKASAGIRDARTAPSALAMDLRREVARYRDTDASTKLQRMQMLEAELALLRKELE
eukprot:CAMPEP_0197682886 /NCGR_PEP_ID=MMETSP1338-20131121/97133_1 /TAXON_ID=43686 ORGANISM="Pelagodinium beii, Strain RCC1491" /NCGR_SAMPLE_ID=MMETSP1338 /ASSEMBLY_ACC=CAM_ASM_000754 /LENGTH=109 /DNA_ID=CAMNT_0043264395 /DNA_START=67 /DNA_END=393 /DNA_ORIENTATION=+